MLTTTAPGIHPEYKRISKWLFFGRLELDDSDIFQSANSKCEFVHRLYYCLQATSVLAHSFSRDLRVRSPLIHHVPQRLWVLQRFPWLLPAFAPRKLDISHVSISKQHRKLLCQSYDFWFLDVLGGWSNNSVIQFKTGKKKGYPGRLLTFFFSKQGTQSALLLAFLLPICQSCALQPGWWVERNSVLQLQHGC